MLTSNNKNPIYYIYHISDINIHCDKRHIEYKNIFSVFINSIKTKNTSVVITGNLLNTKNRITPQEIILAREFIFNISLKCPVIIIPGNNDKTENINAIICNGDIPNPNINYINKKGCYTLNNITFIYDDVNFSKNEYNIGLYHGIVGKCVLYNGKYAMNKVMPVSTFDSFDYTLLGGVSNMQFMDSSKTIAYAGSMIQKDYNEDWNNHGYVLWDLKNNKVNHVPINNEYRYVTLRILDGTLMTPLIKLPKNLYVKWDIANSEKTDKWDNAVTEIQTKIRKEYNLEEEIYVHTSFSTDIPENKYMFDLSIEKQKEYAISWLSSEGKILSTGDKEGLYNLIDKYNKLDKKEVSYIKWKLNDMEFENILCYRTKQKINFNLNGVTGIIAENNAGKSAIFDILVFSLFGKSTRTDIYSFSDLIHSGDKDLLCILQFEDIDTKDKYKITRKSKDTSKCSVSIEKNGTIVHDGSSRDANTYITSLLGTYDDFMTITLMAQNNYHNFLLMSGKSQKEFTSRIFQLDIYDTFHKLAKNDTKQVVENINILKEKMNHENINDKLIHLKSQLEEIVINKKNLENEIFETCKEKENITNMLQPLFKETPESLSVLKQIIVENTNSYSKKIELEKYCVVEEKINIEIELKNLVPKEIEDCNIIWQEIIEVIRILNEARYKKNKKITGNYDKKIKKIDKYLKNELTVVDIDVEVLDKLKEELIDLINNKPTEKIFINLEKIKDKYTIYENVYDTFEKIIEEEKKCIREIKVQDESFTLEQINVNDLKIEEYNKILRKLDDKIQIVNRAKDRLKNHKYNSKCTFCCNNQFVLDAKNDMEGEKDALDNYKKINNSLTCLSSKNESLKLLYKKKEHEKNIETIEIALYELKEYNNLHDTIKEFDNKIEVKNNEIKKYKKEIKVMKSFTVIKNNIEILKKLKEAFVRMNNNVNENQTYNNSLEEKRSVLHRKLKEINEYVILKDSIRQLEVEIERINKEIEIKEKNIEIKKENDDTKRTLTLLSDLIENNNIKIINFIKKETELKFTIEKYEDMIIEYNKNNIKVKELENELIILEYFISMTHHNGIPFYLLKQISYILQDKVNLILSEYSNMQVKIKNEGKETYIQILNERYKNGLNTKMLCGSEKFLIELSFRVAFQTLSNVSKPNFFICDEGWSCLDEKTRSHLDSILKTILEYNDYILTVSHIDDVKKWMNNSITITFDNLERNIKQ